MTKHELREALFKLGLILELHTNNERTFITKEPCFVYAIINNTTSEYELTDYTKELTEDDYQQLEQLLSDYCHTDPLERDVEKEFVLRANELPCFHFEGGYEYLGVSPFNPKKYTHVQKDYAKVFTYAELKNILEKHNVSYKDLTNRYKLIFV